LEEVFSSAAFTSVANRLNISRELTTIITEQLMSSRQTNTRKLKTECLE
jgi:hypothetical protein